MSAELVIRSARASDAAACLEIYRPHVTDTAVSFEYEAPSADEFRARIEQITRRHPWYVAELDRRVVGYAYANEFRSRDAYRWCCETTVYVASALHGRGVARALYDHLLRVLTDLGYTEALAAITLPNAPSVAFHERLGFVEVGRIERCGWKHGQWHAIGFWQRTLSRSEPVRPPAAWLVDRGAEERREKL
jgi:L-amino acid N-acyltransferase YncA